MCSFKNTSFLLGLSVEPRLASSCIWGMCQSWIYFLRQNFAWRWHRTLHTGPRLFLVYSPLPQKKLSTRLRFEPAFHTPYKLTRDYSQKFFRVYNQFRDNSNGPFLVVSQDSVPLHLPIAFVVSKGSHFWKAFDNSSCFHCSVCWFG